jgi:Flp pilus assembly pilin Flp
MRERLSHYAHDLSGATAVEYALIAVLISIVFVAAATGIAPELVTTFSNVRDGLQNALN